jgi:hypothetical protein
MDNQMENSDANNMKDILMALSGLALVVVGGALMMSHPGIRRYASHVRFSNLLAAALPGIARSVKVQSTQ